MNEKQWQNESVTKGEVFKAVEDKMKRLLKQFGYNSYEEADEKIRLAYDGMMDALTAIYDMPPSTQHERQYLISRQADVDEIRKCKFVVDGIEKIRALPFAQPEIIRCKDCKWFNRGGCVIRIVDDSDKPTENDFCSFAERKEDASS